MAMPTIEDVNKVAERARRLGAAADKFFVKRDARIETIGDDSWIDDREVWLYEFCRDQADAAM